MSLFSNKIAGLQRRTFLKKPPVHIFSCKFCQIFQSTFLAKYPFVCHVNLSNKMLPLTLFFPFYFKYFYSKHFSFLKIASRVAERLRTQDLKTYPHGIFAAERLYPHKKKKTQDLKKLGNISKLSKSHRMTAQCPVPLSK